MQKDILGELRRRRTIAFFAPFTIMPFATVLLAFVEDNTALFITAGIITMGAFIGLSYLFGRKISCPQCDWQVLYDYPFNFFQFFTWIIPKSCPKCGLNFTDD